MRFAIRVVMYCPKQAYQTEYGCSASLYYRLPGASLVVSFMAESNFSKPLNCFRRPVSIYFFVFGSNLFFESP